jgi:hypothetical protein
MIATILRFWNHRGETLLPSSETRAITEDFQPKSTPAYHMINLLSRAITEDFQPKSTPAYHMINLLSLGFFKLLFYKCIRIVMRIYRISKNETNLPLNDYKKRDGGKIRHPFSKTL